MFIRPCLDPEGSDGARFKVRDPDTMVHLADEGEEKPESEYWLRRIEEGGVERRSDAGAWPRKPKADPAPTPAAPPVEKESKP